ncbi:MAG TPA: TIGR00645 family protein [Azospirillum sp.]|nr:TIGR00645 family protein [Azospirillum sp.]
MTHSNLTTTADDGSIPPAPKSGWAGPRRAEHFLEMLMFQSRWLLAPLYVGLVAALAMIGWRFAQELLHALPHLVNGDEADIILIVLGLVDLTMVGNLVLMVIFSGYENFVSKIDVNGHADRPDWMGKLDFSGLKVKLIASIVAISSIQVLKTFMHVGTVSDRDLTWLIAIHVTFVISGVLLATMDLLVKKSHEH